MGPEGNIFLNSPISTFQQGLTHSAVGQKIWSGVGMFVGVYGRSSGQWPLVTGQEGFFGQGWGSVRGDWCLILLHWPYDTPRLWSHISYRGRSNSSGWTWKKKNVTRQLLLFSFVIFSFKNVVGSDLATMREFTCNCSLCRCRTHHVEQMGSHP